MGKCGKCVPSGGYENPAVGSWGAVVCGQSVIILLLLLFSQVANLPLKEQEHAMMPYVSKQLFLIFACVHVVVGLIITVLCFSGYFFSSCFLCPLSIVGICLQIFCVVTCSLLGYMLTRLGEFRSSVLDDIKAGGILPLQDFSVVFVGQHEGMILTICVISIVIPVLVGTAQAQSTSTPGYQATVYPGAIITSLASAGIFIFCRANTALAGLAVVWLLVGLGLGISWSIQKACCSRVLSIVLAVIFLAVAVFSVISGAFVFGLYSRGKEVLMEVQSEAKNSAIVGLTDERYEDFKTYILADFGVFLVAGVIANLFTLVFSLFSGLAAVRSFCGKQPGGGRKSTSVSQEEDDTRRANEEA